MRVVLLGPPGAGKGTQAKVLAARLGVPQIATGDILRQAREAGTPLGRKAEVYMKAGALVPDAVVIDMVRERLSTTDCGNGFILDGFPRTLAQAQAMDREGPPLDRAILLRIDEEAIVRRLSGRRQCRSCPAAYHVRFNPSRVAGVCDHCGGELFQRDDDREETVRERLKVYKRQTEPLIDHYRSRGLLVSVEGEGTLEEVGERLVKALQGEKR